MSKGKRHSFKCGEWVFSHTRYYPYTVSHECGTRPVIGKVSGSSTLLCQNHFGERLRYGLPARLLTIEEKEFHQQRTKEYEEKQQVKKEKI